MASLTEPHCTCPAYWQGRGKRPECPLHEADGHPADDLEPGQARRRDGTVVSVMATLGSSRRPRKDPEGMTPEVTWRPVA